MTVAYFCIVAALFIPLACAGYAKFSVKGYDNRQPREFLEKLQGRSQRAHYAQLNFYETFAPFIGGVIVAHQLHAPQGRIDLLAAGWIAARILFAIFYVQDFSRLRSIAWALSLGLIIALFFIGA